MNTISLQKRTLAIVCSLVMCLTCFGLTTGTASAASSVNKVKQSKISSLTVQNVGDGTVKLTWSKASKMKSLDNYVVYRSTYKNNKYKALDIITFNKSDLKKKKLTYVDSTGLENGVRYTYKVRGIEVISGRNVYTKYSSKKSVTVEYGDEMYNYYASLEGASVPKATNVEYYKDSKGKDGNLKSFDRADARWYPEENITLSYYDASNNTSKAFNKDVIKNALLETQSGTSQSIWNSWADIASQLYKQAGKSAVFCGDDEGYYNKRIGGGNGECLNIVSDLKSVNRGQRGERSKESGAWTGVQSANSLSDVREEVKNRIAYCVDRKTIYEPNNKNDLLNLGSTEKAQGTGGQGLYELNDSKDQLVLYNICSYSYNHSKYHYDYGAYGIAFYDFKMIPVVDDNIKIQTAYGKEGYGTIKEAVESKKVQGVSYQEKPTVVKQLNAKNTSIQPSTEKLSTQKGESTGASCTITNTTSTSYGLGLNANAEMEIASGFKLNVGGNLTYSTAVSSANAKGKTESISKSDTVELSSTVPAHTAMVVESSDDEVEYSTEIQMPMELTYKVAIFAITGECYADKHSMFYVRSANYDHGNFVAQFGMGDKNGVDARDSLDLRIHKAINENDSVYDNSYGNVHRYFHEYGHDANHVSTKNQGINWKDISGKGNVQKATDRIINKIPFVHMKSTVKIGAKVYNYIQLPNSPLKPLGAVRIKESEFPVPRPGEIEIAKGKDLNIDNYIKLEGYDTGIDGQFAPFHGFSQIADGHWVECDKNGQPLASPSGIVEISGTLLTGVKEGKTYLKWAINTKSNQATAKKYTVDGILSVNPWEKTSDKEIAINTDIVPVTVTAQ